MSLRKSSKADIRSRYPLYIELGLVVALIILITAFRVDFTPEKDFGLTTMEQEVVQMEEIVQTKQIQKPPPPPRPPVPVEVPNDEIIEDLDLDLDASLDIDEPLADLPPPPPPPEEEEEEEPEPEIFVVVEQMPELIGGLGGIQKKIRYPEIARKAGVEGRVILQFIVDESGSVANPTVVRGIGAGCDEEALRVVREAKFKPGKQRGKSVKVKMSLPITFKLK